MKTALISANEPGRVPQEYLDAIRAGGMKLICRKCNTASELIDTGKDAEIIWFFSQCKPLTPEVLDKLPKCRAIFRSGSGVDTIPRDKCRELGIEICNCPDAIAEAVAEHTVSLLVALAKQLQKHVRVNSAGGWLPDSEARKSIRLSGRIMGFVGYGRIARLVEKMLSGFGMKFLHHDPFFPDSIPLGDLLETADFISLNCPLTDETHYLINWESLGMMKKTALLVNTSRGGVIDETALIRALQNGVIAGAALDVTEQEPPAIGNPLRNMDNVLLTSHIGAFDVDFEKNFWQASVNKILELGEKLQNSLRSRHTEKFEMLVS